MNAPRAIARTLTLAALVLAGCATTPAPRISLTAVPAAQQARAEQNLRVYAAVWGLVADKFYDPKLRGADWPAAGEKFGALAAAAPDDRALYTALNGMLGVLGDRHTVALPPAQVVAQRAQKSPLTGISLARLEGRWVVTETLPGSPAEEAGVRPGWLVVARNGEPLGERFAFPLRDGEVVRWEFLDPQDRPVALALAARPVSTKPRQIARELPGGFVYLRFDNFDAANRRWLSAQLKAHRDAPGVVVDLRRNGGGGSFSLATSVGELFDRSMPCGTFVTRGGYRYDHSSWQFGSAHFAGQVAVLVDGASASAAEIFSAVLQEHGRAIIVGRKSAGAVIGADYYGLPDGGELEVGRYDYFTPKGRRLEGHGVAPDVSITPTLADLRAGRDPDIEAALARLRAPAR